MPWLLFIIATMASPTPGEINIAPVATRKSCEWFAQEINVQFARYQIVAFCRPSPPAPQEETR